MLAARSEIMERMRSAFRAEALDLLPELDTSLLAMELAPHNAALVNRVFRAMHTIKGSGATAGFTHLAHFAHGVEEVFDLARASKLPITPDLIDCGLKACDVIREILHMNDEGSEAGGERAVTEAVARLLKKETFATASKDAAGESCSSALRAYSFSFRPHHDLFRSGTDPLSLLDELRELGTVKVRAHIENVPPLPDLDVESCFLAWEVLFLTECDEASLYDVFVFVEEGSLVDLHLLPHQDDVVAFLLLPEREREQELLRASALCLETAARTLLRIESDPENTLSLIQPYLEHLHPLDIAAMCEQESKVGDAVALQTRILNRVSRVGRPMSPQDRRRLASAMQSMQQTVRPPRPGIEKGSHSCA